MWQDDRKKPNRGNSKELGMRLSPSMVAVKIDKLYRGDYIQYYIFSVELESDLTKTCNLAIKLRIVC